MGQANKRGTFEDRKQQSIAAAEIYNARVTAERERRLAEEQARVDAMPEEEREEYVKAYRARRGRVGTLIGMAALAGVSVF